MTISAGLAPPTTPNVQICSGHTATLVVNNPQPGTTYNWYATLTGGTPFFSGTTYSTQVLTTDTTYYIEAQNVGGCISTSRSPVTVTILPALATPSANNVAVCTGNTATLSVNSPVAGETYNWYISTASTTPIYTGITFTTPVITIATTYYLQSSNIGGCTSVQMPITVSLSPALSAPTANNVAICTGNTATLSVNSPLAGETYNWYISTTATTPIYTGVTFTTSVITANATYYLQSSNSGGCKSVLVPIAITISPTLSAPSANSVAVCSSSTALLSVNSPVANVIYSWFSSAIATTPLHTGTTFTTPVITTNTTYYLQSSNSGGCKSVLVPVLVTLLPTPASPVAAGASICSGNNALLSVTNPVVGEIYNWYISTTATTPINTGITFTTPAITATTLYYLQSTNASGCKSVLIPVSATVLPVLSVPAAASVSVCSGNTALLSVTNPVAGLVYDWFISTTAITPLHTGTTFTTPPINGATTYYLQSTNTNGCKSVLAPITVSLFAAAVIPIVPGVQICNGLTAIVTVSNPVTNSIYTWYSTATSATPIFTGTTYTTPLLTANATYFVKATTSNGCVSGLTPVTVTVDPVIVAPTVTGATICYNKTATITIGNIQPGLTYNWFASATGGTAVNTGTSFTTPVLPVTTTYYVQAVSIKGCLSTRTPVTVTVSPAIADPVVSLPTICNGQKATLSVSNLVSGMLYNWYSTIAGGTPLFTGSVFITPLLTATTSYYVQAYTTAGCLGAIVAVPVTVLPPVAAPSALPVTVCTGQTALLSVHNPVSGLIYSWYSVAVNGTAVSTGTTFQTPVLNTSATYYLTAQSTAGCTSSPRSPVTATALPSLPVPIVKADTICPNHTAKLSILNPQAGLTYNWYLTQTGGSSTTTDTVLTTALLTNSITYYVDATNAGGCSSVRTTVTALVKVPPVVSFTASPLAGCDPLLVAFSNTSQHATSYLWSFGDGISYSGKDTTHIYHSGTFSVKLIATGNGCADTLSKTGLITVVPQPVASFSSVPGTIGDVQLSFANFTFTNTSQNAILYTWQFGDGSSTFAENPRHTYTKAGSYEVTLYAKNTYGCIDTTSRSFYNIIPDSTLNIPNVFSPNNDGVNDTWVLRGISAYAGAIVTIYNRWGAMVYQSTGTYKPWDGKYKGNIQQTATYYYIIQLNTVQKPLSGWLLLLR